MSTCNRTASRFLNRQTQGVRPNKRLKLSALLLKEALCCLQFSTSAAA